MVIRLHNRDEALLRHITNVLGAGSISALDSNNQTRSIFSKKDLVSVIIPLIKLYNLKFLTFNRVKQYALLTHIVENNIVHWDNVDSTALKESTIPTSSDLVNFDFFRD